MHFLDIILKKRNGERLSKDEIHYFIDGYVAGTVTDYQAAALLMAIWFNSMDEQETADLTFAMRDSGDVVDLSEIPGVIVDKHSTGGVADTTSLVAGPIVAACGVKVAKMSGRGLGHTGGTLDKLESIPGLTTEISMERFRHIVSTCNMSIIGQTGRLVPADKLLYALRDTTGTVDNISLIASSIMSKKLASGSHAIVLDVKTGNGAFMRTIEQARQLAEAMVSIGSLAGKKVNALVTDMNQPLGRGVGNALEVKEAIEILQGERQGDLRELSLQLASRMILLAEIADNESEAVTKANEALVSGQALRQLEAMIEAQGGDGRVCNDTSLLPRASKIVPVHADKSGYVQEITTGDVGMAALLLGAGRTKKTDDIDPAVGLFLHKRLGDYVERGEELAFFHVNDETRFEEARQRFLNAYTIGESQPQKVPLVYATIS